ncbi:hypothetical protein L195_g064574, partial [Trifolium pratense]
MASHHPNEGLRTIHPYSRTMNKGQEMPPLAK